MNFTDYCELNGLPNPKFFLPAALIATLIVVCIFSSLARAEGLKASWYSTESLKKEGTWKNGEQRMANGQRFDENALTCACRLYPLGTILRVQNIENGKAVIVRVTDKIGKRFAQTRIDLTKAAFKAIAGKQGLSEGLIGIEVKVLTNKTP